MTARDHHDPGADMTDTRSDDDDAWLSEDDADQPASPRARRRLVTPLTIGLGAVLVATAGFIVGVQVQKGQQQDGGGARAAAPAAFQGARNGSGGAGGQGQSQGQGSPTLGSVANKKGSVLYVASADGTTVRVKTNAQSKVTRNAATSPRGIFPGDTVIVQGTKDSHGDLVATQITATSKTAAANGGGLFGGRGGRPPAGAPGG
jgi:hypothetical protein